MYKENRNSNTLQAFWIGIGNLSAFALSIISAAILARYFNKKDFGTFKQITYVYNTLLVIFTAGIPAVFSYFLPRYTINEGKSIAWKINKVLFLSGILFSLFLFFFAGGIAGVLKNPDLKFAIKVFSPVPLLLLPTLGLEGILSTYRKSLHIAIYNTITRLVMLLCIVLPVVVFKGTYIHAILGWIIASLLSFFLAFKFKNLPYKGVEKVHVILPYSTIFKYSLPIVLASIWGTAIRSSDQFFISRFFGTTTFAEFSNGFIDLPFVAMVTSATSIVLVPVFSKMVHDKEGINVLLKTWQSAVEKSAIIIYPLVIFFIFNANSIIVALYSNRYINSGIYFQIAMVLNFFNIIIFAPLLFSLGKTTFYSNLHLIFAIIAWGCGYTIVVIFKSPVVLAAFSVSMAILRVLIALTFVARLFKVNFFQLFPLKFFLKLLSHQIIIICLVNLLTGFVKADILIILSIKFILFATLLQISCSLFQLNYLETFRPLLLKIKR